jgi:hypothetical protein
MMAVALIVIDVETRPSGMPSNSAAMSSIESIATPTDIHRRDLPEPTFRCQAQRQASAAGPDVGHPSGADPREQQIHQPLGFGTGNQGAAVAPEEQAAKADAPGYVRQRLSRGSALDGTPERGRGLLPRFGLAVEENVRGRGAAELRPEAQGLSPRLTHPGRRQRRDGFGQQGPPGR